MTTNYHTPIATNAAATAAILNAPLAQLDAMITTVYAIPVGMIMAWPKSSALPSKWIAADGAAVNRTTYAALFTLISTTFGTGNGTTTFNVPDIDNLLSSPANVVYIIYAGV